MKYVSIFFGALTLVAWSDLRAGEGDGSSAPPANRAEAQCSTCQESQAVLQKTTELWEETKNPCLRRILRGELYSLKKSLNSHCSVRECSRGGLGPADNFPFEAGPFERIFREFEQELVDPFRHFQGGKSLGRSRPKASRGICYTCAVWDDPSSKDLASWASAHSSLPLAPFLNLFEKVEPFFRGAIILGAQPGGLYEVGHHRFYTSSVKDSHWPRCRFVLAEVLAHDQADLDAQDSPQLKRLLEPLSKVNLRKDGQVIYATQGVPPGIILNSLNILQRKGGALEKGLLVHDKRPSPKVDSKGWNLYCGYFEKNAYKPWLLAPDLRESQELTWDQVRKDELSGLLLFVPEALAADLSPVFSAKPPAPEEGAPQEEEREKKSTCS